MFPRYFNGLSRIKAITKATVASQQAISPLISKILSRTITSSGTKVTPISRSGKSKPLGSIPTAPGYKEIQKLQALFLKDDGLLVWQKRGLDNILYSITMIIIVIGSFFSLQTIYVMGNKKKK